MRLELLHGIWMVGNVEKRIKERSKEYGRKGEKSRVTTGKGQTAERNWDRMD
jgi:hypothetical protein